MRIIIILIASVVACGGKSTTKTPDAAVDAYASECGFPGDMGNELGIGKFCGGGQADCADTPMAHLCSTIGDSTTHFCTKTCTAAGSADQCGTATMCTCNSSNQCGCTPTSCL